MIERLTIDLADRSYEVWAGTDLLLEPSAWEGLPKAEMACVVSNNRVAPLYLAAVRQGLAPHYAKVIECVLPDGEANKHWDGLSPVFDALLDAHADRKTVLVALGGGVVGDMTGFAAEAIR